MAEKEETSKKGGCLKIGCNSFLAILVLSAFLAFLYEKEEEMHIEKCNRGVVESCENLKDSLNDLSDVIINPRYKGFFLEKKKLKKLREYIEPMEGEPSGIIDI